MVAEIKKYQNECGIQDMRFSTKTTGEHYFAKEAGSRNLPSPSGVTIGEKRDMLIHHLRIRGRYEAPAETAPIDPEEWEK